MYNLFKLFVQKRRCTLLNLLPQSTLGLLNRWFDFDFNLCTNSPSWFRSFRNRGFVLKIGTTSIRSYTLLFILLFLFCRRNAICTHALNGKKCMRFAFILANKWFDIKAVGHNIKYCIGHEQIMHSPFVHTTRTTSGTSQCDFHGLSTTQGSRVGFSI